MVVCEASPIHDLQTQCGIHGCLWGFSRIWATNTMWQSWLSVRLLPYTWATNTMWQSRLSVRLLPYMIYKHNVTVMVVCEATPIHELLTQCDSHGCLCGYSHTWSTNTMWHSWLSVRLLPYMIYKHNVAFMVVCMASPIHDLLTQCNTHGCLWGYSRTWATNTK